MKLIIIFGPMALDLPTAMECAEGAKALQNELKEHEGESIVSKSMKYEAMMRFNERLCWWDDSMVETFIDSVDPDLLFTNAVEMWNSGDVWAHTTMGIRFPGFNPPFAGVIHAKPIGDPNRDSALSWVVALGYEEALGLVAI